MNEPNPGVGLVSYARCICWVFVQRKSKLFTPGWHKSCPQHYSCGSIVFPCSYTYRTHRLPPTWNSRDFTAWKITPVNPNTQAPLLYTLAKHCRFLHLIGVHSTAKSWQTSWTPSLVTFVASKSQLSLGCGLHLGVQHPGSGRGSSCPSNYSR